jgi:hypothetical protein
MVVFLRSLFRVVDNADGGELGQEFVIALVHRRVGQQRTRLYAIWTRILRL